MARSRGQCCRPQLAAGLAHSQGQRPVLTPTSATGAHDSSLFLRKTADDFRGLRDQTGPLTLGKSRSVLLLVGLQHAAHRAVLGSRGVASPVLVSVDSDQTTGIPALPPATWAILGQVTSLFSPTKSGKNNSPRFLGSLWVL